MIRQPGRGGFGPEHQFADRAPRADLANCQARRARCCTLLPASRRLLRRPPPCRVFRPVAKQSELRRFVPARESAIQGPGTRRSSHSQGHRSVVAAPSVDPAFVPLRAAPFRPTQSCYYWNERFARTAATPCEHAAYRDAEKLGSSQRHPGTIGAGNGRRPANGKPPQRWPLGRLQAEAATRSRPLGAVPNRVSWPIAVAAGKATGRSSHRSGRPVETVCRRRRTDNLRSARSKFRGPPGRRRADAS